MNESFDELLPATRRALHHRIAVAQADGRAPSLVGAVIREGRTVWTGSRGRTGEREPDGDTQYRIGSITKTFTAVLVLRLRDEGLLDLSDPLERHLPGTAVDGVTIAQLLAHTSGIAAESPGPWWERTPGALRPELADVLGEAPLLHPPGLLHHYSNPGYTLLGALVERLRGRPWDAVLRQEVLEPLGMERTSVDAEAPHADGWAVHPWADVLLPEPLEDLGLMGPAGTLWSTSDDLGRWAHFLAEGDDRVLCAASVAGMRTPAAPPADGSWDAGYGLGLQLMRKDGRTLAGHTGSLPGFLAAAWLSPEDGLAAVVLANTTSGVPVGALAADLVSLTAAHEPLIPPAWTPSAGPAPDPELLALTGSWYWGPTPFVLRLDRGSGLELAALTGTSRASRFRPSADGTWTGLDGYYRGEVLRVVRGDDGEVSHLDLGSFVFTRRPYDAAAPVPGGVDPDGWR
ncbi:serine hydrolase domain-containing protein [Streptomyces meridianus]|uniref:Serine hydrolase n=1 Tax=Streptomyces meridianus TaxID=2938945 RepID=A0ABT0X9R3_9ACTN|nr:serine hydrolase [Streptomyces meridianus]MCM2578524.1 serine hydrolase [Streptomyces meridianus]